MAGKLIWRVLCGWLGWASVCPRRLLWALAFWTPVFSDTWPKKQHLQIQCGHFYRHSVMLKMESLTSDSSLGSSALWRLGCNGPWQVWGPFQMHAPGSQAWSGWGSGGFRSNWGHFMQQNCWHLSTLVFWVVVFFFFKHLTSPCPYRVLGWWTGSDRKEILLITHWHQGGGWFRMSDPKPNSCIWQAPHHYRLTKVLPHSFLQWMLPQPSRSLEQSGHWQALGSVESRKHLLESMLKIQELIFLWGHRSKPCGQFFPSDDMAFQHRRFPLLFPAEWGHHLSLWNFLHSIKLHFLWFDHIPLAPVLNFLHHTPSKTPSVPLEETWGAGRPLNSGCKFWMISVHSSTWFISDQVQNKPLSVVLQAVCLSDLIPWIYFSLPLYNRKGFDLGHTWMV